MVTLEYVQDHVLTNEAVFAQRGHFFDERGRRMKVCPESARVATRSCIEGGILKALWQKGFLDDDETHQSSQCRAVMCALAETLGVDGAVSEMVNFVQDYSNRKGYAATMQVVRDTIDRLKKKSRR